MLGSSAHSTDSSRCDLSSVQCCTSLSLRRLKSVKDEHLCEREERQGSREIRCVWWDNTGVKDQTHRWPWKRPATSQDSYYLQPSVKLCYLTFWPPKIYITENKNTSQNNYLTIFNYYYIQWCFIFILLRIRTNNNRIIAIFIHSKH